MISKRENAVNDIILIQDIKDNNSLSSFEELVERHSGTFVKTLNHFAPTLIQVGISYDEAAQDKNYLFGLAITSFDSKKKVKFVTWFTLCCKYHFLNLINRCQKYDILLDNELLDFVSNIPCDFHRDIEKDNLLKHFEHIIGEIEDKKVRDVLFNRYFSSNEPNLKQISKSLSLKTSAVYNLHKKGLEKVKSVFKFDKLKMDSVKKSHSGLINGSESET